MNDATGTTTYTWDDADRLVGLDHSLDWGPVAFSYATDGLLAERLEGSTSEQYVNDTVAQYALRVETLDGLGAVTTRHLHGIAPLRDVQGTAGDYVHAALGTTRVMLTGPSVDDTQHFSAWGEPEGPTVGLAFGYAAEQAEVSAGLQYLRARWMHPESGRFTSRDSFEGVAEIPGSRHSFLYVENAPLRLVDPGGNFAALATSPVSNGRGVMSEFFRAVLLGHMDATAEQPPDLSNPTLRVERHRAFIRAKSDRLFDSFRGYREYYPAATGGPARRGALIRFDFSPWRTPLAVVGEGGFFVRVKRYEHKRFWSVVTLQGHPLRGYRYWRYKRIRGDLVLLETGAASHPARLDDMLAMWWLGGYDDAESTWHDWFHRLDIRYGDGNAPILFGRHRSLLAQMRQYFP